MKKNIKKIICFISLASTLILNAQTTEFTVYGSLWFPKASLSNNTNLSKSADVSAFTTGKGFSAQTAIYKNGFIGLNYMEEKANYSLQASNFKANASNVELISLNSYFKTNHYTVNWNHRIYIDNDSAHAFRFALVPLLELGFTVIDQYQYRASYSVLGFYPGTNITSSDYRYYDGNLTKANPLDIKGRVFLGLGVQLNFNKFLITGGFKYGLTKYQFGNDILSNYWKNDLSGLRLNSGYSHLYFGIGYSLATFSKKNIFNH